MAWKYRKRIKIAPGVTINVSRSGVSTTIGPKRASVNISKNGTYLNTGIPGTGIYDRQKIGDGTSRHSSMISTQSTSGGGNTIGYNSSGCFWFIGIAWITLFVIYGITGKFDLPTCLLGLSIAFVLWIIVALISSKGKSNVSTTDSKDGVSSEETAAEASAKETTPVQYKSNKLFLSWKKENFDLMQSETKNLYNFLKTATRSIKVRRELDRMMGLTNNDGSPWPLSNKINLTMMLDAYRCYTDLGYKINADDDEELGLLLLANNVANSGFTLDYFQLVNYRDNIAPTTRNMYDTVKIVNERCSIPAGQYFFQHVFENVDKERMSQYMVHLYRYASAIAKADDTIDARESEILENLMKAKDLTTDGKPLKTMVESKNIRRIQKDMSGYDPIMKDAAKFLVKEQAVSTSMIQRKFSIGYNRAGRIMEQLEQLGVVSEQIGTTPREVLVLTTDELEEIFYEEKEEAICNTDDSATEEGIVMDSQSELQSLIGLSSVKAEVEKLTNFIKIMKAREKKGLPVSDISYHCVFTGNPGTGKTTVARILANIYSELGIIKKGHLVETDRSGLVAEYVGQTAVKTNKIIDSAIDGVLFIDEAYSLVNGGNNDYGTEAISTLLKRMEDDRKRLVVILAGYGNEMQSFINSNPGLQSRFNRYIDFPDYNAEELLEIYKRNLKRHKYTLSAEAEAFISAHLANTVANKNKNFGNARFVRNLFEKTLENQAMRLASIGHLTSEILCEISIEDVTSLKK
ncbi:MAG: DUF4236 domain-containing protein [Bacteroidaceae bacterium]|nr:DUF4236 domain-containing protein [Bacteroidaceae bacterium]